MNSEDDAQLKDVYYQIAKESEEMYRVAYLTKFKNKSED